MANDVDEFTIKYKVDAKDADKKLDNLNDKLKKTGKSGKESGDFVEQFASKMMSSATKALRAGTIITTAILAIRKVVKEAVEAMKDYNEQMMIARRSGVGTIGQEAIALNMARASGGRVNRSETRQAMGTITEYIRAAYTDPSRMNAQNVRLRMLGINPTGANGMIKDTGQVMDELGKRWKNMTEEMARAEGDLIGITPQAVDAIKKLGGAVSDTGRMTAEMLQRQAKAVEAAGKLHEAVNGMADDFDTINKAFIDDILPIVAKMMKLAQAGTHMAATSINEEGFGETIMHGLRNYWKQTTDFWKTGKLATTPEEATKAWEDTKRKKTPEEEENDREMRHLYSMQQDAAKRNQQASAKLELSANQFATAVAAMPGSVSEQEAIAAWAGEAARGLIGGAQASSAAAVSNSSGGSPNTGSGGSPTAGSSGGKQTRGIRNNNPGNLEYNNFTKGLGATGTDGRFAIFPTMEAGVKAHETLLGGKSYAGKTLSQIINRYAPASENNVAAYIASITKQTGIKAGDIPTAAQIPALAAAMQVHESGYRGGSGGGGSGGGGRVGGAATMAGGTGLPELNLLMAARGVPGLKSEQLLQGGYSKEDATYFINKHKFDLASQIISLQGQIAGADQAGKGYMKGELQHKLFTTQNQMMAIDRFGGSLINRQKGYSGSRISENMPTVPQVNVTINGAQDPAAIVKILTEEMKKAYNDQSNKFTS